MCVLDQLPAPGLTAGFLTDLVLSLHPGAIARLDTGANLLLAPCGQGSPLFDLARQFPRSRLAGLDDSDWAVRWARLQAGTAGLANLWFEPAAQPPPWFGGLFHLVVATGSRDDDAAATTLLARLTPLLAPGGVLFWLHDHPSFHARLRAAGWRQLRHLREPRDDWPHVFIARR